MQNQRFDLLRQIYQSSFAVDDIKLYLDTHPCDEEALSFLKENSKIRNMAMQEYAKLYGPLTVDLSVLGSTDKWNWINGPWPWQEGGC